VSKLKVVSSSNVRVLSSRAMEIMELEGLIKLKANPTNRDRIVFAYHFCRLGNPLKAQVQLNLLSEDYFENEIFRDLWKAMLAFSFRTTSPQAFTGNMGRAFEYFLIIRKVEKVFLDLNFKLKSNFLKFIAEFNKDCFFTE